MLFIKDKRKKMLSCNCLNVIIESETNDFQKVIVDSLNLSEAEKKDDFFKQDILQVGKLIKINKIHAGLIKTRVVGSWIIYQCINCNVHSHAIHRDRGAAFVLVAATLLTVNAINALRNSDKYSAVFNVIVNKESDCEEDKQIDNYVPSDVETTIKGLKQVMLDVVKHEMLTAEEKIRQFTEDQYLAVDNFRDKAFKEQKALTRVILNSNMKKIESESSTKKEMSTKKSETRQSAENVPDESSNTKSIIKSKHNIVSNLTGSTRRAVKSTSNAQQTNSFDAEGLFEFDGMDDIDVFSDSDLEESDHEVTDSGVKDDGVKIPRNKSNPISLAKSLPMNIPPFMSFHHSHEDQDDVPHSEDPLDIAASIKALAKSVHGDTVFGDLPRPRFSTQI